MDKDFLNAARGVMSALEHAGVSYAVTGSIASSIHGEPLSSLDVDICCNATEAQMREFLKHLPQDYYRSDDDLLAASRGGGMANLISMQTALKVDLSVLKDTPYYRQVLARKRTTVVDDEQNMIWTVTPEDIVLMKLEWRITTQSQKQWENALSVVRTQRTGLDFDYMRKWAVELNVSDDLERLLTEAGI